MSSNQPSADGDGLGDAGFALGLGAGGTLPSLIETVSVVVITWTKVCPAVSVDLMAGRVVEQRRRSQ